MVMKNFYGEVLYRAPDLWKYSVIIRDNCSKSIKNMYCDLSPEPLM